MSSASWPRLQILLAALLFSTGGMAIKGCQLTSYQIASFRCGVAALVMWLLLPQTRRGMTRSNWWVAAAYAATLTLYVLANKNTTAANAIFLQSAAPIYVLLLGHFGLGERIVRRDLATIGLMLAGLALILWGTEAQSSTAPAPMLGNLLAVAAGLTWGLTVLGLRFLGRPGSQADPATAVVWGNVLACAAGLPLALPVAASHLSDWLWILYLGVCQIALAYVFLTQGVRRVPAFEASLLLLLDPLLTPVWAFWLHGEKPGLGALCGGAIVLLATVLRYRPSGVDGKPD